MIFKNCSPLALLPLLVLTPTLAAQQTKVVPIGNTSLEGSTLSVYPFGYTNPRCQQIWAGSTITTSTGLISSISYRSDSNRTTAEPGRAYANVTFDVGVTTMTPSTLSTTFSNNITSPMTNVISGAYNLPAMLPPLPGTQPFNVAFAWNTPFIFTAANGDLLLDVTLPGTIGKSSYFLDAEYSATNTGGTVWAFGTSGVFSTPEVFALAADAQALTPGGALSTSCGKFSKAYIGTLVFGLSNLTWSGATLPLDLGFLGAPNNSLHVSMDMQLPFTATASGASFESALRAPIPNSPSYNGLQFFLQAYYADAQANNAGLVSTHGLAMRVAGSSATIETQLVGNADYSQTSGSFPFGTRAGGPVTQFTGILP